MRSRQRIANCRGFTLVEMVAVIVLLGIVAAGTTQFVRYAVTNYRDTNRRDNLTQVGRLAVERMTRELRGALPGSVRVSNSGSPQCVEFVPVLAVTSYFNNLAGTPISSIEVVDFTQPASYSGTQVVIYPIDNGAYYSATSTYREGIAAVTGPTGDRLTINLSATHTFPYDSPQMRVFIVGGPVSFCASDNQLLRYQGYALSPTQQLPPAGGDLLAEFIRLQDRNNAAIKVFEYTGATQERNAVVTMDLRFTDPGASDEWVSFRQQVLIHNTP